MPACGGPGARRPVASVARSRTARWAVASGAGRPYAQRAMATALFTHSDCLEHRVPAGHPERPDRLRAILAALDDPAFAALDRREAPLAEDNALLRAHPRDYLDALAAVVPEQGIVALDADTFLSPGSLAAARRSAGAGVAAVDAVLGGEVANAFCATRPPGHHAETAQAMGFCLFGTAVIAARHAQAVHGAGRVAIVDFDVHHGNGTQDLVWRDETIAYVSSHQSPLFPGTGQPDERGAHGQILNLPVPDGTSGAALLALWEETAIPFVEDFSPDLLVVSAGFDAHRADPLAGLRLSAGDFGLLTTRLGGLAGGNLVSVLEGGYALEALAESAAAHVAALMELGQG